MAADEGDCPGLVTWIICRRRSASTLSSLIHPREAFTRSQRFSGAVCQRRLPLKRR